MKSATFPATFLSHDHIPHNMLTLTGSSSVSDVLKCKTVIIGNPNYDIPVDVEDCILISELPCNPIPIEAKDAIIDGFTHHILQDDINDLGIIPQTLETIELTNAHMLGDMQQIETFISRASNLTNLIIRVGHYVVGCKRVTFNKDNLGYLNIQSLAIIMPKIVRSKVIEAAAIIEAICAKNVTVNFIEGNMKYAKEDNAAETLIAAAQQSGSKLTVAIIHPDYKELVSDFVPVI